MNRSDFLRVLTQARTQASGGLSLSLDPYTGPWTEDEAIHLLRRVTFGFSPDQVAPLVAGGMANAVATVLDVPDTAPDPPLNIYSTPAEPDPDVPYGETWVNAPYNVALPVQYYSLRTVTLKAWWMGLMMEPTVHIREKMALFWHNHFAIEADTVQIAQPVYFYLKNLQENCLGNFKSLTKDVSRDVAMLFYLNGYLNSKSQPDENYSRELQELFTVGKGPNSQYTEEDVKEAARILTGYRINPFTSPISMFFDFTQHDTGSKNFSSFYNNTTINGQFGNAGQNELDDLLDMIFANDEVALFICRKLYQFFVYYEITPEIESNIIVPLAQIFRNNNYEIRPVMETLLQSQHFYDTLAQGCVIKTPLDFVVGMARQFKVPVPSGSDPLPQYQTWSVLAYFAALAGMNILDPPLVSGWPAWYQSPVFHRAWINSDTLAGRLVYIDNITGGGAMVQGYSLKLNPIPFAQALPDPSDPNILIEDSARYLFALPISTATRDYYKSFLLQGLDDSYWTTLWFAYLGNPGDPGNQAQVVNRLSALYREMMNQAEYHLS